MMVAIVLTTNIVNHRVAGRKQNLEASRLRAGLKAELHALLDLYESNLVLLRRKANYLLCSRPLVAIYKGNLGRVTALLDHELVGKVVTSFAQNEKIEAVLTARAQPKGGSSYKIDPADFDFEELVQMYEDGKRALLAASQALDAPEHWPAAADGAVTLLGPLPGGRRAHLPDLRRDKSRTDQVVPNGT